MGLIDPKIQDDTLSELKDKIDEPSMYKVLLHNDDYTTMEFVIEVLISVFNKTQETATQIMLNIHRNGIGICGIYTYEVAETKVDIVHRLAKERNFPLKSSMERE